MERARYTIAFAGNDGNGAAAARQALSEADQFIDEMQYGRFDIGPLATQNGVLKNALSTLST